MQFNGGNAGGHGHPRARPPRRPVLPGPKPPQFTEHFEENYDDELPYVTPLDDADFNGKTFHAYLINELIFDTND